MKYFTYYYHKNIYIDADIPFRLHTFWKYRYQTSFAFQVSFGPSGRPGNVKQTQNQALEIVPKSLTTPLRPPPTHTLCWLSLLIPLETKISSLYLHLLIFPTCYWKVPIFVACMHDQVDIKAMIILPSTLVFYCHEVRSL